MAVCSRTAKLLTKSELEMEDAFGELDVYDLSDAEEQPKMTAREARLEAARLASKSYKAKYDEPFWFDQADPTSLNERESIAATAFQAQSAYLYGNFSQTMDCSLRLFDVKEGDTADRAQVLDLLLRSSMKCGRSEEVLVQAKDYVGLSTALPALALSAAQMYDALNMYSDAVEAYLHFLSQRLIFASLDNLCAVLRRWSHSDSALSQAAENLIPNLQIPSKAPQLDEGAVDSLPLSQEGRERLLALLKKRQKPQQEDSTQDNVRSVNTL